MEIKSSIAAILFESKKDLIVDRIFFPDKLKSGQVLVRIISSGICGAQINEIDAIKGRDKFLPHLLGHEGFCEVIECDKDVTTLKVNDYAIMHWRPGSGIQADPAKYTWMEKDLNAGWVTTFSEYAVVSENRLTKIIPGQIKNSLLPLLGCALTTAYGVVKNEALPRISDNILILGVGGVGISLIVVLRYLGCRNITVADTVENKLLLAEKLGIKSNFIFRDKSNFISEILKVYGQSFYDVVFETTGSTDCIEAGYELSSEKGKIILIGVPKAGQKASIYTLPLHFGKRFFGSEGGASQPNEDIPYLIERIKAGEIDLESFPITEISLDRINEGINQLRKGAIGRVVIQMGDPRV